MNYYELFEIDQKAEPDEIKRAYRQKLMEWHPDKNPHRRDQAEEMTKTLNTAYDVLSDTRQRVHYDRILRYSKGKEFGQYVNDDIFGDKIRRSSGTIKEILNDVKDLYFMTRDSYKGKYRLHPVNMGIIAGGLLYFIIPTDFIPDFIPFLGLLDDVAILTTIIKSMQGELHKYRNRVKQSQ
ncbi:MAG: DnaJ domain-containing protein [Desulfatiglans sp.]|jgi:curved DNA-binding protein CbpA|nr:DnaJ domain-containing protein [Desulfatiglans sp.]